MIVGETISVISFTTTSYDSFNAPVRSETAETVSNVLIEPAATSDITDSNRPDGHQVKYVLHFPKSYAGELEGREVVVRGERLSVIGHPARYTEANTPGDWNMRVEVGGVHG